MGRQSYARRWYHQCSNQLIGEGDLRTVIGVIKQINGFHRLAKQIPQVVSGDQGWGDRLISEYRKKLTILLDQPLSGGGKVKDCLVGQHSILQLSGYGALLSGYPMPGCLLVREEYISSRATLFTEILEGSREIFPASPVNPKLLHLVQIQCVDGTALASSPQLTDQWERWQKYSTFDSYAEMVLEQHHLVARNGYLEMATVARAMKLEGILQAVRLKAYSDFIHYPRRRERWGRRETGSWDMARSVCFRQG